MHRIVLMVATAATLTACTVTGQLNGQIQNSSETFVGTLTGNADRSGQLHATTSGGAQCDGDWVSTERRKGEGVFRCSDGRSGPFQFVSTGAHGTGHGSFGADQNFTFTFVRD